MHLAHPHTDTHAQTHRHTPQFSNLVCNVLHILACLPCPVTSWFDRSHVNLLKAIVPNEWVSPQLFDILACKQLLYLVIQT